MLFIKKYITKYQQLSKRHKLIFVGCGLLINIFLLTRIWFFLNNLTFNSTAVFVVAASKVIQKDVNVNVYASGTVQPITTITVKSQIDGVILNNYFTEGQMIQQGQLLFEIDPSQLQALYKQSVFNLAKEQAVLQNAMLQLQKSSKLYKNKLVSDQDYQQIQANFKIAEAGVNAATAAVDAASVQLAFTKIYSPITGFAGQILVNSGNVIKAAAGTSLVSVNQVNPVFVLFSVPEEYLPELLQSKLIKNHNTQDLIVTLDTGKIGSLVFVDNKTDNSNGMVALKSKFCNCNLALWPGQFVNVSLTIKKLLNALVIPNRAVQVGQDGTYVYVVELIKKTKKKSLAKVKKSLVTVGPVLQDETVITAGLTFEQIVVTEGHSHLADNDIVEIYAY